MSLHRIIAPPPLALAVHPAPAPKTRKQRRQEGEARQAAREARHKQRDEDKAAKVKEDRDKSKDKQIKVDDAEDAGPEGPQKQSEVNMDVRVTPGESAEKERKGEDSSKMPPKAETSQTDKDSQAPGCEPQAALKQQQPLIPIRFLAPAPPAPLHARIDLEPGMPYPPVPCDPRGAYHKYAKALGQTEDVYIDVTKDGWLAPIWKERTEREALDRLTGEADRQSFRETLLTKEREMVGHKQVPDTAQELVLELWNALVETPGAPFREVSHVWSRVLQRDCGHGIWADFGRSRWRVSGQDMTGATQQLRNIYKSFPRHSRRERCSNLATPR